MGMPTATAVDLKVYPCNGHTTDVVFQKCHLPLDVMMELNVMVGSHVEITLNGMSCVCSVWPQHKSYGNCLQYDNSVYKKQIDTGIQAAPNNTESNTKPTEIHNKIKPLRTGKAAKVNISVIVEEIAKVKTIKNMVSQSSGIHKLCIDLLLRTCVADGYTVQLGHCKAAQLCSISSIVINECEGNVTSKYDAFVVQQDTEIVVNSVHSREWFEHVNVEKPKAKVGGLDGVISILKDMIMLPLLKQDQFIKLGVDPPRGVLLRGPPGCGKTTLVRHAVALCNAYLISINGPEMFGPHPGETESSLRNVFSKAVLMSEEGPCVVFVDELDSICPCKDRSAGIQEARVTGQFLSLLDGLTPDQHIAIIGATNRPSAVEPALRRPGRLDREIMINVPTKQQRWDILAVHIADLPMSGVDLDLLADITNGYVGADLEALCHEASYLAMSEMDICKTDSPVQVNNSHFIAAVKKIRPSMQKGLEGVVDLRPVKWSDIGGLDDVKTQVRQAVEWPLRHPDAFQRMGLPSPKGVLLYGPPGCCKTTLVRAAATATQTTFLSISGAQLYSPYVGDSERLIVEVFQKARAMAPSIIFLDEIDSIVGKRSESSQRGVQERVLSALLNEMDGIGTRLDSQIVGTGNQKILEGDNGGQVGEGPTVRAENRGVLLVAATNRPDLLDEALVRPGRIDRAVYVPPPDYQARKEILNVFTRPMALDNVDLDLLARKTHMYTGADLENLCREAALCALTEDISAATVTADHFAAALASVKPSLTVQLVNRYSNMTGSTFACPIK